MLVTRAAGLSGDADDLAVQIAGLLAEVGRADANLHVRERRQIGRETRVERAAAETGHRARELAAELLRLDDPALER